MGDIIRLTDGECFCGVTAMLGDGISGTPKLPTNRPTWRVENDLPGFSRTSFEDAIVEALHRWELVCDLVFDKHVNPKTNPTEIITVVRLDGPSGVLADQMLPYGNGPFRMRIDSGERQWFLGDNPPPGAISLTTVLAHEFGHLIGLSHFPPGGQVDLMEPTYNPRVTRPQAAEALFAAKLYGQPKADEVPSDGPVAGRPWTVRIDDKAGNAFEATGVFRKV